MMKKSTKLVSVLLSIIMTMSVFVFTDIVALAQPSEDNKCGDNVTYHLDANTKTLTISGTGAMWDYAGGESPFFGDDNIENIVVENGVTSVGDFAFTWCDKINKVYLADTVESIGESAFEQKYIFTTGIKYIKLPTSLNTIKNNAFNMCDVAISEFNGSQHDLTNFFNSKQVGQNNETIANVQYSRTNDSPNGRLVKLRNSYNYLLPDGSMLKDELVEIDENLYYFDEGGEMAKGLYEFTVYTPQGNNNDQIITHCFFNDDGTMAIKQWVRMGSDWSYFDSLGYRCENYTIRFDDYYEYGFDEYGVMLTGWQQVDTDFGSISVYFYPNGILAKDTWLSDGYGWLYVDQDGFPVSNSIVYWYDSANDDYVPYYLDYNGRLLSNTWYKYYEDWIYIKEDGSLLRNSWIQDSYDWLYLGDDGFPLLEGVAKDSWGYLYLGAKGYPVSNRQIVSYGTELYSTGDGGYLKSGWEYFDLGKYGHSKGYEWVYFDEDGFQVFDTLVSDSYGILYMGSNGFIQQDVVIEYGGEKLAMDANGYLITNSWYMDNGNWYYANENGGRLKDGWALDSHGWLYMDYNGEITRDDWSSDYVYYFDSNGYMVTGWYYNDVINTWLNYGSDGRLVKASWVLDSVGWCYVNDDGYMVTNDWIYDNANCYYVDANGHMVTGGNTINGVKYIFDDYGRLL